MYLFQRQSMNFSARMQHPHNLTMEPIVLPYNLTTVPSHLMDHNSPPPMDYCSDDDHIPDDDSTDNPDYNIDDILQGLNSAEFKYVQPILALMVENLDILSWNENMGEIIFKNNTVKDSNVIELLKDTLTDNLHPVGKMEFYRGLVDINVKNRYSMYS